MRLPPHHRRHVGLIVAALVAASLAACATRPSPWSPEVDKLYKEMYHPTAAEN